VRNVVRAGLLAVGTGCSIAAAVLWAWHGMSSYTVALTVVGIVLLCADSWL